MILSVPLRSTSISGLRFEKRKILLATLLDTRTGMAAVSRQPNPDTLDLKLRRGFVDLGSGSSREIKDIALTRL